MEGAIYPGQATKDNQPKVEEVIAFINEGYKAQLGAAAGTGTGAGATPAADDAADEPAVHFSDAVTTLTDANFDTLVTPDTTWVVDMYATWCGHCQALAPEWDAAAKEAKSEGVRWGAVDVDQAGVIATRFNVEGLPTIVAIKGGQYWSYEGERDKARLLDWVRTQVPKLKDGTPVPAADQVVGKDSEGEDEPPAAVEDVDTVVLTDANFDQHVKRGETWLVEVYATWCGHCKALAPIWAAAATQAKGKGRFGKVEADANPATAARFGVEGFPTILLITAEGQVYDYAGPRAAKDLVAFATQAAGWEKNGEAKGPVPDPVELPPPFKWEDLVDPDTVVLTDASFKPADDETWIIECYAEWCGHCQALAPQYAAAATLAKTQGLAVRFGKAELDKAGGLQRQLGVQGFPTIVKVRNGKYVEYPGERTAEAIVQWAKEPVAEADWIKMAAPGEAPAQKKAATSLDVTAEEGDVLALTDDTFTQHLAKAASMPQMVDFYATWCGHCKALAPAWAQAATASKKMNVNAQWVKVDVDQSPEVSERFNVEGLPTIVAIKGNKYWSYEGSRDAASLLEWAQGAEWTEQSAKPLPGSGAAPSAGSSAGADEDHVVNLTDDNFDKLVKPKEGVWMIEFFAPWCGHCKKLQPTWKAAASISKGFDAQYGKVDVDVNHRLSDRFKIEGLPTIIRFEGDRQDIFEGPRSLDAILEFGRSGSSSAADSKKGSVDPDDKSVQLEEATFEKVVVPTEQWLLWFSAPWCSHCEDMKKEWAALTKDTAALGETRLGKINTDEADGLIEMFNITGLPTVLLLVPGEPRLFKHIGVRNKASFLRFISSKGKEDGTDFGPRPEPSSSYDRTLLNELTDETARARLSEGTWMVAFIKSGRCTRCVELLKRLETVATALKDQSATYKIGVIAAPENAFVQASWGVKSYPQLFVVKGDSMWSIMFETYTDEDLQSMLTFGMDPAEAKKVEWMGLEDEKPKEKPQEKPKAAEKKEKKEKAKQADKGRASASTSSGQPSSTMLQIIIAILVIVIVGLAIAYYNARKKIRSIGIKKAIAASQQAAAKKVEKKAE